MKTPTPSSSQPYRVLTPQGWLVLLLALAFALAQACHIQAQITPARHDIPLAEVKERADVGDAEMIFEQALRTNQGPFIGQVRFVEAFGVSGGVASAHSGSWLSHH